MTKRTRGLPAKEADTFDDASLRGKSSHVGFLGVDSAFSSPRAIAGLALIAFAVLMIASFG